MNFDYNIANHLWRFCTDYPFIDNDESEIFKELKNISEADWICSAKAVNQLPKASGTLVKETKEQRIYLENQWIWLELLSRESDEAWFVAKYSINDKCEAELWVLDEKRPYTARIEHLWSAINFPYQLLKKNILTLHSAVIEYKEKAILFLAPSCTGKSTQAKLWEDLRGARQLNGDKAAVFIAEEQVKACGLPFCGTSSICENYELPVEALVILSQSKENQIARVSGVKALSALLGNCFGHLEVPGCSEKIVGLLMEMLKTVPVYSLACTPDEEAVIVLEQCLQEE